ncbi:MAG: hypothetical protein AUF76_12935 [Acidobacteria bacterium 13_1_20CM_2_65_9]|nr:MAG: hypothetical protein AUF76_12935 [Acidobacteria bacterium 13_1_20CM_2_65_9]
MKSVVGPFVIAVLLALAGAAFWMAGQTERRLAEVHQQLAVLRYGDAMNDDEDVDASLGVARRLPRVGESLANEVRNERALAQYWQTEYAAIEPKRDASGIITETDPQLLLVGANAEFRASQHATDRAETLRRLDRVVKTYGDVLRTQSSPDVSYNYEYAVRLRENLSRGRQTPLKSSDMRVAQKTAAEAASDLPVGPTLHGYPGGPPKGTDMSQFKIVIPKRGEERKDNPEAGKGGAKVRKG